MNALLSRSGIFFLMNSSRDGRISSAIIPPFGDFDFLQTWQTSGAVLIGIRCRIKALLHCLSIPVSLSPERACYAGRLRKRSLRGRIFFSIGERNAQTVEERNLPGFQFASRSFVRKKAGPIDLWKILVFPRARRPFQLEQVRFALERFRQISFKRPGVHNFAAFLLDPAQLKKLAELERIYNGEDGQVYRVLGK